ncbi:MAG: HNH endonuclease [Rhodospirillaceae bacterium]|nr:HNH endonuclease [Rhodospirillaceae bacterium]
MLNLQTLVLNADFRPLSYHPLSLWSWKDALSALLLDRVNLVENYDVKVRSPSIELEVPSVVALKRYIRFDGRPAFTRYNIYLRDDFSCQYCAGHFPTSELTFDHVQPKSRGGRTEWTNVVSACAPCNIKKANRTPLEAQMPLIQPPLEPSIKLLNRVAKTFHGDNVHHTWVDYVYWDSELYS